MIHLYYVIMRVAYWVSWPLTGLLLHNSHRVRILVQAEGSTLLLKSTYGPNRWSLPGGGVDRDESAKSAAVRELIEETGIIVDIKQLTLLGTHRIAASKYGWPVEEITFFKVTLPKRSKLRITRPLEIKALGWASHSDMPIKLSPAVKRAIELQSK